MEFGYVRVYCTWLSFDLILIKECGITPYVGMSGQSSINYVALSMKRLN